MCTAISYRNGINHYFGRNLDLECSFPMQIVITPSNYLLTYRNQSIQAHHHSMIGTAVISQGYPLYFEATNDKGLSIAGLNFPGNAVYLEIKKNKINLAPFELIPWVMASFSSVEEAVNKLSNVNLINSGFSDLFTLTPLHWILSDRDKAVTLEPTAEGLMIYENAVGVLTNNPPFPYHMSHLSDFLNLSPRQPDDTAFQHIIRPYSNGMGAIGLPGDYSSASRFIKATFVKCHSLSDGSEQDDLSQFFHILRSVEMPRGSVLIRQNAYEITQYSCCCNTQTGVYYYTSYGNSQIIGIDMRTEDLSSSELIQFPFLTKPSVWIQNA